MLKIGAQAPSFELLSDENKIVRSAEFAGKIMVLFFYPKNDDSESIRAACSFRDEYQTFKKANIFLLGISSDTVASHETFRQKYKLPFNLLADTEGIASKAFDIYRQKEIAGKWSWGIEQTTYVLAADGRIKSIFPRVRADKHADDILATLVS